MKGKFALMLRDIWDGGFFGCVGLDCDAEKLPACLNDLPLWKRMFKFNQEIIDATGDLVRFYKPNAAFYEAVGQPGLKALRETIKYIKENYPHIIVIYDAKRADIGNTNNGYVSSAFDYLGADAITVNPYFGAEALAPFLDQEEKGVIVLCKTSNPGAAEFQDRQVLISVLEIEELMGREIKTAVIEKFGWMNFGNLVSMPFYQYVALRVSRKWNLQNNNCAVVVGATYPEELGMVRELVLDLSILIPAIGKQGGDVIKSVKAGADSKKQGMIFNNAREIIFASSGSDFAEAARNKTIEMNKKIEFALAA